MSSSSEDSRKIGDTATYEAVEVTPTEYITASEIDVDYDINTNTGSAGQGAVFVLTHLYVVHNGNSAQAFPPNGAGRDTVDNVYDGETVHSGISLGSAATNYVVDGTQLPRYDVSTGDKYPGAEAEGWILTKVAENFDPAKLELRITWNQQFVGDDGETTHTWTYAADAEASVDDIENNDDNTTTVEI